MVYKTLGGYLLVLLRFGRRSIQSFFQVDSGGLLRLSSSVLGIIGWTIFSERSFSRGSLLWFFGLLIVGGDGLLVHALCLHVVPVNAGLAVVPADPGVPLKVLVIVAGGGADVG